MKWFRVPIAALMALVLAIGLSLAAFRSLSEQAASAAFAAMWTVLLAAVVASRFGRYRTFWAGFWIVGGGYAFLAFAPGTATEIRPHLATTLLLDDIAEWLELPKRPGWFRFSQVVGTSNQLPSVPNLSGLTTTRRLAVPGLSAHDEGNRFLRIGHSIAAIVHGIAGGIAAVVIMARGPRRRGETG